MSSKTFEEEEPELFNFIIRECPDLFAEDGGCLDYEQLRIAFFLMNEETKGQASKWYPYIVSLP